MKARVHRDILLFQRFRYPVCPIYCRLNADAVCPDIKAIIEFELIKVKKPAAH